MAVIVDVYQDKRKTGNNLWYGRAWHPGILDTRALAKRIEQNVSVKESDVYAVLIELAEVMTYEIANGNKCHLDRFGYFGVTLRTTGALTEKDFSIKEHIKNYTHSEMKEHHSAIDFSFPVYDKDGKEIGTSKTTEGAKIANGSIFLTEPLEVESKDYVVKMTETLCNGNECVQYY